MTQSVQIRSGVSLAKLNTLGVESQAEYFCEIRQEQDLLQAQAWAQEQNLEITVLGGGSNLILKPYLAGLVCHMQLRGLRRIPSARGDGVRLRVAAGENWHNLVRFVVAQSWHGLETLALIPGSVGAAPIQNIGAYGTEIAERVRSVRVLDCHSGQISELDSQQCQFGYRDSLFKRAEGSALVVLEIELQLAVDAIPREMYPDVQAELLRMGQNPTRASAAQIMRAVIQVRRAKLPDPRTHGNVGSLFKNPVVASALANDLQVRLPHLKLFPIDQSPATVKLSAAQLIDAAKCKGLTHAGFGLWPRQPLVAVNVRGRSGVGLLALAERIKNQVQTAFGVSLELEPRVIGGSSPA